ncbi:MAG: alpha/beta hydrolase [Pyramidobacter sp.]|nr:alpha/beta hydrolase [Pyramidobacter sp.]
MATKDNFFQTSDGLWLYYEVHGEGRPIVMLPGFGEALTMWHHNVPQLSENHKVVCLDLRGHGRSMKVAGGNRQVRMAQDVRELIDHLGLKDVLLVGHSLGGAVAATYADKQKEYALRGLVLVDASLYAFSDEEWNEHGQNHFNIDGWYERMLPYITDPVGYAKKSRGNPLFSPEDDEILYLSKLQLPPFVGVEYHLDTYFTDNMTPLADRTIPVATFVSHSAYHNAWRSGHEAVERMKKSPLALCYEFTKTNNHFFPILEWEKFNECLLDFEKKIDALESK